ncbi:MAG: hypothetical protein KKE20_05885, partial [Nanoarchaeota archaeon]|nr:hypothetical protein [Nanoarchaeota archaeon]
YSCGSWESGYSSCKSDYNVCIAQGKKCCKPSTTTVTGSSEPLISGNLNSVTGLSAADTCTDNPGFSCTATPPASGCKGKLNCASGQQCCPTTSSSPNIVPPDQCSWLDITNAQYASDGDYFEIDVKGVKVKVQRSQTGVNKFYAIDFTPPQTTPGNCEAETLEQWTLQYGLFKCRRIDETKPYSYSNCQQNIINDQVERFQGRPQAGSIPFTMSCSRSTTSTSSSSASICFNNVLARSPCTCGDQQIKESDVGKKFCYKDFTNNKAIVLDYQSCVADQKVTQDNPNAKYIEIDDGSGNKRLWCGCSPITASMVDCTNQACKLTDQGNYACVAVA